MRSRRSTVLLALAAAFFLLVVADALGVFDRRPYSEVPHGDHTHYVPRDRDPNTSLDAFPTRPPRPGERITPTGQIVAE